MAGSINPQYERPVLMWAVAGGIYLCVAGLVAVLGIVMHGAASRPTERPGREHPELARVLEEMRASRSRRPRAVLEPLVRDYLKDERVLICPSVALRMREPYWPERRPPSTPADDMAYCYVSGLRQTDPYDRVLAFDEEWSHDAEGVNVLRAGGQVEWVDDAASVRDAVAGAAGEIEAAGRRVELLRPWWSRSPEPPPFFRLPEEKKRQRRRWPYAVAAAALAAGALVLSLHRRRRRARQARAESEQAWERRHGGRAKRRNDRPRGRPPGI